MTWVEIALFTSLLINGVMGIALAYLWFWDVEKIAGTDGCCWPECECCQRCACPQEARQASKNQLPALDEIEVSQLLADLKRMH